MALPSYAATPTLDDLASEAPASPAAVPPLGFFDRVKLGAKSELARPSWGFNETNFRNKAISEVDSALRQKGVEPEVDLMNAGDAIGRSIRPGESYAAAEDRLYRQLFAQVARVRQADPKFLPDFSPVLDKPSFDHLVNGRQRTQLEEVGSKAPDGLGAAGLLGSIGAGMIDPVNWLPVGGTAERAGSLGRQVLLNGLRWGAANAAITAGTEPLVREHAQALGVERTAHDFVVDLLASAGTGFVLGGAAPVARFGTDKLGEVIARRRATDTPDNSDAGVAGVFSELVPAEQRTPDEQAALHAVQRQAEVNAGSPFVPGPLGDDQHGQWLDAAMHAVTNEGGPQRPSVKPVTRESIAAGEDASTTRAPAREVLKAKIGAVEGTAKNAASGAEYQYQFIPRTWVALFKRRYPNDPRSFDQIAALRRDPALRDVLINDLISENAAALRHAGFDESAGNLYLAHVLGHDRAVNVLRADPEAKLGALLPDSYFKGNPFRREDSAASLVRWAYGKMGDKGFPAHAATPEVAQAAEAIGAGEADPQVELATGRNDVEAMFGDVGMTDRPVLRPELFASPEEHAAAQVRFERERDATEGYAPVMSRAEAFMPGEHFDALRNYKGTVTAEAIGEALGLSPGEVRRAVGSMQAVDRNSPFMLTRGRQPRFDAAGNVTREGTEAGRVIRRPPRPLKANETMLEYLTRTGGGLKDVGGDLKAMGGEQFHQGAPFRRKLIDNEGGQSLDDAYQRAIDAGYFPEHIAGADDYRDLPDISDFLEAIDAELRGRPRHAIDDAGAVAEAAKRARYGEEPPEAEAFDPARFGETSGYDPDQVIRAAAERGIPLIDLDADMEADIAGLMDIGLSADEALDSALLASGYRHLEQAAAETGNGTYVISPEERFIDDGGLPEQFGPEQRGSGDGDLEAEPGGRGPGGVAEAQAQARSRLAQSEDDPASAATGFGDPVGHAAEAQADSLVHDLEMAAEGGGIRAVLDRKERQSLRLKWLGEQERKLGREAAMEKLQAAELADEEPWLDPGFLLDAYRDDPDAGGAILEAIAEHEALKDVSYRLGEEGAESDLGSILDEINEAQKAAATMRDCLKPKGGAE